MYNVPGPAVAVLGASTATGLGGRTLAATGFSSLALGLVGASLLVAGLLLVRIASTARRRQAA